MNDSVCYFLVTHSHAKTWASVSFETSSCSHKNFHVHYLTLQVNL